MGLLQTVLSEISITSYLTALIVTTVVMIVLLVLKKFVLLKLFKLAKKTSTDLDDFVLN